MKGQIIAIEGCDGVGKHTQAKLFSDYLSKIGIVNTLISFPTYGEASASPVEMFLNGKIKELSPIEISMLFAFNRSVEIRNAEIEKKLKNGEIVIFDRYVSSNIITNAAHIKKKKLRKDFAARVAALEFGILSLPEPNIEIYLDMSFEHMIENIQKRKGTSDVNEDDMKFLKKTNKVGRQIAKWGKMSIIQCSNEEGKLRSEEDIHNEIKDVVHQFLEAVHKPTLVGETKCDCDTCDNSCDNRKDDTSDK